MKVLVIFVLLAFAVHHSAADSPTSERSDNFIGELQEFPGGPIIVIGGSHSGLYHGVPSCRLVADPGNPICATTCISRHHIGGFCNMNICTCVG